MGLSAKVVTFTKAVATGNQAITGVGFQGRAVLFYAIGAAASGTWIGSSLGCIGFAAKNSSNVISEGSVSWSTEHTSDPTVNCRRASSKAIVIEQYDQTTRDIGTFVSFDSDGFTVNWTTASADTRIIHALVLGGSSLTDASVVNFARITTTGDQAVTGAGFVPDFLFGAGISNNSSYDTTGTAAAFSFGATDGTDSFVSATFDNYNVGTSSTAKGNRTGQLFGSVLNSTLTWNALASFVSFDSDGFTINWSANQGTAGRMVALCLKGGNYKVGTIPKISSASVTDMVGPASALSFEPTAVLTASCFGGTLTGNGATHAQFAMGASDGVDSAAIAMNSLSGATTASVECVAKNNKSIIKVTETSRTTALQAEAEDVGMFSNGFAWLFSTNDASSSSMNFVAMGPKDIKDVTNQVTNPSFEVNTAGWLGSNMTISRITSDAHHGSACLKCIISSTGAVPFVAFAGSGTGAGGTDQRRIPAVSGDIVYASAWVKAGNAGMVGQVVKLQSRGIDAVGANLGTVSQGSGVTLTTSWQQITLTSGTQPASTAAIQFLLRAELSGLAVSDEVYFDEVDVRVNQPFDVYLDGAGGTYHGWIGTTNDSKSVRSKIITTTDVISDGYLVEALSLDVISSGHLVSVPTQDVTGDSLVQETIEKDVISSGLVSQTVTTDVVGNALLAEVTQRDVFADALMQTTLTQDASSDGLVQITSTNDLLADAMILATITAEVLADALTQHSVEVDLVADGLVLHTQTLDVGSDGYVLSTLWTEVVADAIVKGTLIQDLLSDGYVQGDVTLVDIVVDGYLTQVDELELIVDGVVLREDFTHYVLADGFVLAPTIIDVIASAHLTEVATKDLTADAYLQLLIEQDVMVDGVVKVEQMHNLITSAGLQVYDDYREMIAEGMVRDTVQRNLIADGMVFNSSDYRQLTADGRVVTRVGALRAHARIVSTLTTSPRVADVLPTHVRMIGPGETKPVVTEKE